MSWKLFKNRITDFQENHDNITIKLYAEFLTQEYDRAIKLGKDTVNGVPVLQGNKQIMEEIIFQTLKKQQSSPIQSDILQSMGRGVLGYWTAGVGSPFPIPILPAPGSVQNIAVTSHFVVNPGTWPPTPIPLSPSPSIETFIDNFISLARQHLTTVGGVINTISLYPPLGTPGPGIISWTGYTV